MRKSIKEIVVLVLALQLIIPYPVYAASVGRFTSVVGNVTQTRDGKVLKPVFNSQIHEKDKIVTGDKSTAKMVFEDKSSITLQPNSEMVVKEFAVKGNVRKGIFSLSLGKLVADVTKFIGGKNAFEVHTPTAVCGVRGTGFEVAVAGGGLSTTITCTSGSLAITAFNAAGIAVGTTTLVAGQAAVITASGIQVVAAGAAAVGTSVTTATGTGVVTTGAGAGAAGTAAGTGALAGVGAGTVAAGAAVAAGIATVAITASGGSKDTPVSHHTTPSHH